MVRQALVVTGDARATLKSSRCALLLAAGVPACFALGPALGGFFYGQIWAFVAGALSAVVLIRLSKKHFEEFEKEHSSIKIEFGADSRYLKFHAIRAHVKSQAAVALIWLLWAFPALICVYLACAVIVDTTI